MTRRTSATAGQDPPYRDEAVKITLSLSKKSVDFFESEASKHHTQYQRMIRRLVDSYVESQQRPR